MFFKLVFYYCRCVSRPIDEDGIALWRQFNIKTSDQSADAHGDDAAHFMPILISAMREGNCNREQCVDLCHVIVMAVEDADRLVLRPSAIPIPHPVIFAMGKFTLRMEMGNGQNVTGMTGME